MMLCPDVVAFPESPESTPDLWVLYNVHTRTCLGVDLAAMAALGRLVKGGNLDAGTSVATWKIWRFSNADGLLNDPSRFKRDTASWGAPEMLDIAGFTKALKDQCILIEDMPSYLERFGPKRSMLDKQHFGNYHQQLGQYFRIIERQDPEAWWLRQKFTADLAAIRQDNLYGAVQDRFLTRWIPQRLGPGVKVLDLGCGPGVIAQKMASAGASVLGVDPNPSYIQLAAERAVGDARFEVRDLGKPGVLDDLPSASFDVIYMSDALLFYFIPYSPDNAPDIAPLIQDLLRLLKPGGSFVSLEPHPVFYVQPWLGAPGRPFTFVTEYLNTRWRINPPLARLTRPFLDAGFVITNVEELASAPEDPPCPARDTQFAAEFPVWLLLEMKAPAVP